MSVNKATQRTQWSSMLVFAVINVFFLSVAFGAGYVVRAFSEGDLLGLTAGVVDNRQYPLLAEVRALLEDHFIGDLPDDQTLEYGAVRGLVQAVNDPYTLFVEPQAHELDSQSLAGEYGGIGTTISTNATGEIVLAPYRNSPAARAGVLDGDVLLAVDDQPLPPGTSLETATALIRGLIDTMVKLEVRHPAGDTQTISLKRERFEIPSAVWRTLPEDPSVGFISVSRFSGRTAAEVAQAIDELEAAGVSRYVLDLRNNGGGILDAAVNTAALFLDGGVVMYESQRNGPEKTYSAPENPEGGTQAPLVVLVNGGTASAAEILAGALLDRGRAPLVGQTTYGKGSVQLVYDLSDGSSLHVTAYRWYTPARRDLQGHGLPPTYAVAPATDGSDAELLRALDVLNNMNGAALEPLRLAASPLLRSEP